MNQSQEEFNIRNRYYKSLEEASTPITREDNDYVNYLETLNRVNEAKAIPIKYQKFSDNVYRVLFSEAFIALYNKVRGYTYVMNESNLDMSKNMIRTFFEEKTDIKDFIRDLKAENTLFLSELLEAVEMFHEKAMCKVDKCNDKTFVMNSGLLDDYYAKLTELPIQDLADTIRTRVSMAVQDYVMKNHEDKAKLEELVASTKENIKAYNGTTEEGGRIFTESMNNLYKQKAYTIRNARAKNLLEQMIYKLYETSLKDDGVKARFLSESTGKIDMDNIQEYAEMRYTVLEMFNTAKVYKYSEQDIAQLLED